MSRYPRGSASGAAPPPGGSASGAAPPYTGPLPPAQPRPPGASFGSRAPTGYAVPPPRPVAGQASAEYVALLAVVGVVVAGAAAVGSPPALAARLAAALRHGICRVAGGVCTAGEARLAGLAPCLVHARTDRERLGGRLLVVRLGRGDALLVERRSDGSASVSFTDGATAGGVVGVGLQLPAGLRAGIHGGA